jgi:hypothetical protein
MLSPMAMASLMDDALALRVRIRVAFPMVRARRAKQETSSRTIDNIRHSRQRLRRKRMAQ